MHILSFVFYTINKDFNLAVMPNLAFSWSTKKTQIGSWICSVEWLFFQPCKEIAYILQTKQDLIWCLFNTSTMEIKGLILLLQLLRWIASRSKYDDVIFAVFNSSRTKIDVATLKRFTEIEYLLHTSVPHGTRLSPINSKYKSLPR